MSKSYSITEAKILLGRAVHEAEAGDRVELTRRGRPVAVLVSAAGPTRLDSEPRDFWKSYQRFRERFNLGELDIDPTELFGSARDRSPGKDFSW